MEMESTHIMLSLLSLYEFTQRRISTTYNMIVDWKVLVHTPYTIKV